MAWRRVLAGLALVACLAASLVPCPPAYAGAARAGASVAPVAVAAADAEAERSDVFCRSPRPPDLLPACPCGCKERPSAAGVPVAPGLALFQAAPALVAPPGENRLAQAPVRARPAWRRAPDPVPLRLPSSR